jgi:hypothetical protein
MQVIKSSNFVDWGWPTQSLLGWRPVLVSAFCADTEPVLSEAAGAGILTSCPTTTPSVLSFRAGRVALMLHLILGGAAVHRCDNCIILNTALAAEGATVAQKRLSPQTVSRAANRYPKRALQFAENSSFVSGHRFSDAARALN